MYKRKIKPTMKCWRCQEPFLQHRKDVLACPLCIKSLDRERRKRYAIEHDRESKEYAARYRRDHAEKIKGRKAKCKKQNGAKYNEKERQRYYANREARLAQCKQWRNNNPHKLVAYANAHRARKAAATVGDKSAIERFYLKVKTGMVIRCYWCNRRIPMGLRQVDHIVPLSRGGRHEINNLCSSCQRCNRSKGNRTVEQFTPQGILF